MENVLLPKTTPRMRRKSRCGTLTALASARAGCANKADRRLAATGPGSAVVRLGWCWRLEAIGAGPEEPDHPRQPVVARAEHVPNSGARAAAVPVFDNGYR